MVYTRAIAETSVFFFQAEDGIRDSSVTGVQACVFPQAEDGIRDSSVTGVQTCALPIFSLKQILARDAAAAVLSSNPTAHAALYPRGSRWSLAHTAVPLIPPLDLRHGQKLTITSVR